MVGIIVLITLPIWMPLIVMVAAHDAKKNISYISHSSNWDPLDPADPYNDCPDCGSGDSDGNHCYD